MPRAVDFIRYCLAKHGDGQQPQLVAAGSAYFDPAYVQACIKRALASGKLSKPAERMASNLLQ